MDSKNNNEYLNSKNSSDKYTRNYKNFKRFVPSLMNVTFKNKRLEETINSENSIKKILKISSASSLKNSGSVNKYLKINIRKHKTNNRKNYNRSAINFHKRSNDNIDIICSSYKTKEKKEIKCLENEDKSNNILSELDRIQNSLFKQSHKRKREISKILDDGNGSTHDSLFSKDLNEIFNKGKKNSFFKNKDSKCDSSKTKNNSTINIFHKKISKTMINKKVNTINPERIKSSISNLSSKTRLLDRKKINGLPVTFPLYLSYNNRYNSIGERNRIDKLLTKLSCLKTYVLKDEINKYDIIKEFLINNGFNDKKYFEMKALYNFYHYLLKPFSFPSHYILADIINEAINYKPVKASEESLKSEESSILNFISKAQNLTTREQMNKKTRNRIPNIKINNISQEIKYSIPINNKCKVNIHKSLPLLIKDLESELKQIKVEKSKRLEKYNSAFMKKYDMVNIIDKNKYIPNLCLINKYFKEKCKKNVDKKNRRIVKHINRQEKMKEINNRMYYDIINKNKNDEYDREEIKKRTKLTEFIVMERAKKKYLLENQNNKPFKLYERIKINKSYI